MNEVEIRKFTKGDLQLIGLHRAVTSRDNAVFWWVGAEDNWSNVFIAMERGQIIAKGQVNVMTTIPLGSPKEHKHYIYINLKTLPDREDDYPLYDLIYERLLNRAYELRDTFPSRLNTQFLLLRIVACKRA